MKDLITSEIQPNRYAPKQSTHATFLVVLLVLGIGFALVALAIREFDLGQVML